MYIPRRKKNEESDGRGFIKRPTTGLTWLPGFRDRVSLEWKKTGRRAAQRVNQSILFEDEVQIAVRTAVRALR